MTRRVVALVIIGLPYQVSHGETEAKTVRALGEHGSWVVAGSARGAVAEAVTWDDSSDSTFFVGGELAWDRFLEKRLSIGFVVEGAYRTDGDETYRAYGIGGRLGVYLPLSACSGVWPLGGLFVYRATESSDADPSGVDYFLLQFTAQVPFIYQIVDHVLVGVGPSAAYRPEERTVILALSYDVGFFW
jgi:hypothetical protein